MNKILLIFIITAAGSVFAQHNHNKDDTKNMSALFTTQNAQYSAEVESDGAEFLKDSLYSIILKLSSSSIVDTGSVKLLLLDNDSDHSVNNMKLLNDKYIVKIRFDKEGRHVLKFTFKLTSVDGIIKDYSFSFNTDVKNSEQEMDHHGGMMGMGSTGFWVVMGGVMVGMMAIIMILSSHK